MRLHVLLVFLASMCAPAAAQPGKGWRDRASWAQDAAEARAEAARSKRPILAFFTKPG